MSGRKKQRAGEWNESFGKLEMSSTSLNFSAMMARMARDTSTTDFTLVCGQLRRPVHSCVLANRSPYFEAAVKRWSQGEKKLLWRAAIQRWWTWLLTTYTVSHFILLKMCFFLKHPSNQLPWPHSCGFNYLIYIRKKCVSVFKVNCPIQGCHEIYLFYVGTVFSCGQKYIFRIRKNDESECCFWTNSFQVCKQSVSILKMNCGCLCYGEKVSLHQGAAGEFVIKLWKGVAVGWSPSILQ